MRFGVVEDGLSIKGADDIFVTVVNTKLVPQNVCPRCVVEEW